MKYLILIILVVFFSCSGTKQVVENTPKDETVEIEAETEVKKQTEILIETTIPLPSKPPKEETVVVDNEVPEAFNHNRWNNLLVNYVSEAGNVNYNEIKNNKTELHVYIDSLGENTPNNSWSKEDKLAYWINAYNAMTIDLIVRNMPIKSIKDIKEPWDQRLWKLGDKWFNLNEIEHQILRKMDEPRIHFAIVCASFSCPKLQNEAFSASNLEAQLTNATKEFLSDSNRNTITKNNLKLSKIFKWFAKDFKQKGSLIDFLNQYSEIEISSNSKKSFKDYNWDLND